MRIYYAHYSYLSIYALLFPKLQLGKQFKNELPIG